jgi:electron transport complex protein RnfE
VTTFLERLKAGLWFENPGLVQLLGLCPLLAVTTTLANGFGLGIATLAVLVASNALVSATRRWIRSEIRIPIYVLIIASLVTCTELVFKAWFPALDRSLGIFIPLIVTNCAIVARAEVFASRNPIGPSIVDGIVMGTGFALLLVAIGAFRELVSLAWLLAVLPPGAFFSLALAIAAKNALDERSRGRRGAGLQRHARAINR